MLGRGTRSATASSAPRTTEPRPSSTAGSSQNRMDSQGMENKTNTKPSYIQDLATGRLCWESIFTLFILN